jgi:hypothetical protein
MELIATLYLFYSSELSEIKNNSVKLFIKKLILSSKNSFRNQQFDYFKSKSILNIIIS